MEGKRCGKGGADEGGGWEKVRVYGLLQNAYHLVSL